MDGLSNKPDKLASWLNLDIFRKTIDLDIFADLLARKAGSRKLYEKRNDRPRRFMDGMAYDEWMIQPNYDYK